MMTREEIAQHIEIRDASVYINNLVLDLQTKRVPRADVNHSLDKVIFGLKGADWSIRLFKFQGTFGQFRQAEDYRERIYSEVLNLLEIGVNRANIKL